MFLITPILFKNPRPPICSQKKLKPIFKPLIWDIDTGIEDVYGYIIQIQIGGGTKSHIDCISHINLKLQVEVVVVKVGVMMGVWVVFL